MAASSRDDYQPTPFIEKIVGDAVTYHAHFGGLSKLANEANAIFNFTSDEEVMLGHATDILPLAFSPEAATKNQEAILNLQIKIIQGAKLYGLKVSSKETIALFAYFAKIIASFAMFIKSDKTLEQPLVTKVIVNENAAVFEELLREILDEMSDATEKLVTSIYQVFSSDGIGYFDVMNQLFNLMIDKMKALPATHPLKANVFKQLEGVLEAKLINENVFPLIIARQAREFLKNYHLVYLKIYPALTSVFEAEFKQKPAAVTLTTTSQVKKQLTRSAVILKPSHMPGEKFPQPRISDSYAPAARTVHSLILSGGPTYFAKPRAETKIISVSQQKSAVVDAVTRSGEKIIGIVGNLLGMGR